MLVSHSKKFVFVHNPRTGGTSIHGALRPWNSYPKKKKQPFENHSTLNDVVKRYKSYYKFGFVRNPWDRYVSMYQIVLQKRYPKKFRLRGLSFSQFIMDEYRIWQYKLMTSRNKWFSLPQYKYFVDHKDSFLTDFIGKFENLEADFQYVCSRLEISVKLEHKNASQRKHYKKYYNEKTKAAVAEMCQKDIQLFGYQF